jgi:hypothetical protein
MKTLFAIALLLVATAAQAETITTQLFDESGIRIGMAIQAGKTTTFYDIDGKKTGTAKTVGRRTIYFDTRGKKTNKPGL